MVSKSKLSYSERDFFWVSWEIEFGVLCDEVRFFSFEFVRIECVGRVVNNKYCYESNMRVFEVFWSLL